MNRFKINYKVLIFSISLIFALGSFQLTYGYNGFADVPEGHWASEYIYRLRDLGIVKGKVNEYNQLIFGINENISRAEFLTMLVRLINDEDIAITEEINFIDVKEEDWFYENVLKGINSGIIYQEEFEKGQFLPNQNIKRIEMTKMIVRALGYEDLAKVLNDAKIIFPDVSLDKGYVKIANDLGVINGKYDGKGNLLFYPGEYALRTEAVAMISRMKEIIDNKLNTIHGFYAINSYGQMDKIKGFNSIGFGWSALVFDKENNKALVSHERKYSDYYLPKGYIEPYGAARDEDLNTYLMVYSSNSKISFIDNGTVKEMGLLEYFLSNEENQNEVIDSLVAKVSSFGDEEKISFEGIIIDFEGLKSRNDISNKYVNFIRKLKNQLDSIDKKLILCLHPIREGTVYFDGYDYGELGKIADKIIIMAHDYEPISINDNDVKLYKGKFPLAPIEEVYTAITKALEKVPKEKILLQISLNKVAWTPMEIDGVRTWERNYISYSEIAGILDENESNIIWGYDSKYQSPYVMVLNNGEFEKIIWYEDGRSVSYKIKLAKDFGLDGISIWRLGLIGDGEYSSHNTYYLNIWKNIKELKE